MSDFRELCGAVEDVGPEAAEVGRREWVGAEQAPLEIVLVLPR